LGAALTAKALVCKMLKRDEQCCLRSCVFWVLVSLGSSAVGVGGLAARRPARPGTRLKFTSGACTPVVAGVPCWAVVAAPSTASARTRSIAPAGGL
jgi:hypothetical protein